MNEINSLQLQIEKQTAQIVLNTLCTIDKNCILAGDAPRDWYFNKPATDFVLDSFPLSISKIAWKDGVLYPSEDFKLALKYNAIFQTSQGYANNTEYFNKILSKFPDKEFFTSKERMINSSDIFSLI